MPEPLREYLDRIERNLEAIYADQRGAINKAARLMADRIKADGLIYVFGSGGHLDVLA